MGEDRKTTGVCPATKRRDLNKKFEPMSRRGETSARPAPAHAAGDNDATARAADAAHPADGAVEAAAGQRRQPACAGHDARQQLGLGCRRLRLPGSRTLSARRLRRRRSPRHARMRCDRPWACWTVPRPSSITASRTWRRRWRSLSAGSVAASAFKAAAEATSVRKSLSEMRRPAISCRKVLTSAAHRPHRCRPPRYWNRRRPGSSSRTRHGGVEARALHLLA